MEEKLNIGLATYLIRLPKFKVNESISLKLFGSDNKILKLHFDNYSYSFLQIPTINTAQVVSFVPRY